MCCNQEAREIRIATRQSSKGQRQKILENYKNYKILENLQKFILHLIAFSQQYISSISNQSSVSAISSSTWYQHSYHIEYIYPVSAISLQYQQSASANDTGTVTISSVLYPVSAISSSKWYMHSYHIQCIISSISNQHQQMVQAQLTYRVYISSISNQHQQTVQCAVTVSSIISNLYPVYP